MKKLIFLLVTAMLLVTTIPINAHGNRPEAPIVQLIQRELEKEHLKIDYVERSEFNALKGVGNISVVTEYNDAFGNKILEFNEKGLYNKLEYKHNGDVYLNGDAVRVETYDENQVLLEDKILNVNEGLLRAKRTVKMEQLPIGLTDADLPEHLGMTSNVVSIGRTYWNDVGVAVIVGILTIPFYGLWGVLASATAAALVRAAKNATPYSNSLSTKRYERKGMYVGGYIMIVKSYFDYFGNRDFTGYLGNSTHYTGYDD